MDYEKKLIEVYEKSFDISDIGNVDEGTRNFLDTIISRAENQKGVYTVLVTLMVYKILHPGQDIRNHQVVIPDGFSGRSIDTRYITPTLKKLGLPAMSESGWLTRSLEQRHPYNLEYEGSISGKGVKEAFLGIIDVFQNNPDLTESCLRIILNGVSRMTEEGKIDIQRMQSDISPLEVVDLLKKHFGKNYNTQGGSKLPVLAFYALCGCLISEVGRYKNSSLAPLGSHTASDEKSNSAGDIEIKRDGSVYEVIEIKFNKPIDVSIIRNVYRKISSFRISRYYALSTVGVAPEDKEQIDSLVNEIKAQHDCLLVVNGFFETLEYYLRLISSTCSFLNRYVELVEKDNELKTEHKKELDTLIKG